MENLSLKDQSCILFDMNPSGYYTGPVFYIRDSTGEALNYLEYINEQSLELIYSYQGIGPTAIQLSETSSGFQIKFSYDDSKSQMFIYKISWQKGYFYVAFHYGLLIQNYYKILNDNGFIYLPNKLDIII